MRCPAYEKLGIIRLVEQSHLAAKRTPEMLGIPATTFHRWYDRHEAFGQSALANRRPHARRVWNRIPGDVRQAVVDLALQESELSPRERAIRFTDTKEYCLSEASVYRILKAHDLITGPAFIVIKAADAFRDKTMRPNEL